MELGGSRLSGLLVATLLLSHCSEEPSSGAHSNAIADAGQDTSADGRAETDAEGGSSMDAAAEALADVGAHVDASPPDSAVSDTADADASEPDSAADADDSGSDSDAVADGAAGLDDGAPRRCSAADPFRAMGLLPGDINGTDPDYFKAWLTLSAHLSLDELTLYFSSTHARTMDIYSATRADRRATFRGLELVNINAPSTNKSVSVTGDQLRMYFLSNRNVAMELYLASRRSLSEPFGNVTRVENLSTPNKYLSSAFVTPDGNSLYLALQEGFDIDLYVATHLDAETARVDRLENVNLSDVQELNPVISADGLVLYFARGPHSLEYDVFVATRASTSAPFGAPREVPELKTPETEMPDWISPDLCTLYYTVYRTDRNLIWVATR